MLKIKRALISVSDKTGVVELAGVLHSFGVEIISTGGTAKELSSAGIPVVEMSSYTGFPEMLDGRVKTLHPKIHAGLLSLRDNAEHMRQINAHQIGLIDMVVVNLYPFEATVARDGVALHEAIENIDIGGPSMLRSAAKNYRSVAVVCDARFYPRIIAEMRSRAGSLAEETLEGLALEVFKRTSSYDGSIAAYLDEKLKGLEPEVFPSQKMMLNLDLVSGLRYGENPHQKAGLYACGPRVPGPSLVSARQLHGKELSFNNYLDLNAALEIIRDFPSPAACVIKHTNPTGVAQGRSLVSAYRSAWRTDPLSAFGGIIGLNGRVDEQTAKAILKSGFMECVLAAGFEPEALELLRSKKNIRLLEMEIAARSPRKGLDLKKIDGGMLVQEADALDFKTEALKFPTKKKPTKRQLESLFFAWRVVKHVRSNAIVIARGQASVGIGMGQTSRVDSVFMALKRAGERARQAVLASDAFFPKPDNVALAKKAGIAAIIQPGGSIADEDVIRAADRAGIAMAFTGVRHFKH